MGYARQSGIPYGIGFIKNKYIGRTFIQPTQADRENLVRIKLNPVASTVKGKRVVLVDDSIVRGTTCGAHREAAARGGRYGSTHARLPPRRLSTPAISARTSTAADKLIACKHTVEEICRDHRRGFARLSELRKRR